MSWSDDRERKTALHRFLYRVGREVQRARELFPSPDGLMTAATEEAGEVAKAVLDQPWNEAEDECVQAAAMFVRLALEGDPTLDEVRARRSDERRKKREAAAQETEIAHKSSGPWQACTCVPGTRRALDPDCPLHGSAARAAPKDQRCDGSNLLSIRAATGAIVLVPCLGCVHCAPFVLSTPKETR